MNENIMLCASIKHSKGYFAAVAAARNGSFNKLFCENYASSGFYSFHKIFILKAS